MNKIIPVILLFFAFNTYSQKEANFWYFGEYAGLDFSTNPPSSIRGSIFTDEGSASISNSNGDLQFYTDGSTVFDSSGNNMNNGTGLFGNSSSSQSAIIVPKPKDSSIYYIFTVGNQNGANNKGVMYSIVDMSLNGGVGEITSKNNALNSSENAREKITSVRGAACNTFWLITSDRNNFYTYLIDENGVQNSATIFRHNKNLNSLRGYLKISPDGKTLVNASASSGTYIFDFNPATGEISGGDEIIGVSNSGYGVEFSRNGKKLYISSGTYSQINPFTGVRNTAKFANITQFSLESNNILDINNSAVEVYRTNTGYRGALQLASNGKIYYARSRTNFLGIINAPEKEAANINFVENGVSLGQLSTEGLPPFIQSFFLDINIKDNKTNNIINNQELQLCIGENRLIKPEEVQGTNVNYELTFNDGTSIKEITSSQTITNLTLNNIEIKNAGTYNLKITLKDLCDNDIEYNGTFNISVHQAASAKKPNDINSCDEDLNGFNIFDLQNNIDLKDKILTGLDTSNFEILYFNTLSAAADNVADTDLPNPYEINAGNTKTIHVRVQNINAPNACYALTSFTIAVTGIPVPETPSDYSFCDNTSVGSDTDGFINNFILKEKDKEILGENLDAAQYSVSYHTSEIGAKTSTTLDVIDKTTNYKNTTTNTQPIYVRVENVDNNTCFDASKSFKLIVNPLPVVASSELEYCLSKNNTNPTINLTLAAQNISNNYLNELFIYYEDELRIDEITNSTEYPVITNTRKSVYVKVFNKVTLCSRAVVELVLNIATEDDNSYDALQTPVCDDFTGVDASDTDKITNFYLNKAAIINSINPPANTNVFFYESINNRANSLDEIDITEYRNKELGTRNDTTIVTNGIQFPIYYKILSEINNNCQGLGQFYVQINTAPTANPVASLELCDSANDGDGANGIAQSFNLESQTLSILGAQNTTDYTVTYHLSKTDANAGNNPQASPFTNTTRDLQTIYIRVTDNNTNCFTDQTSFDLVVTPLPFANFVEDLEICDDNSDGSARNGFSKTIDLESQTGLILGTQDPTVYSITYHHTLLEAQNGSNPLFTPYSNTIPYEETIFVRIYNSVTMCNNSNSNFNVIVNPEPIVTAVSNLSYCDDDADGDDENQIIQNIDLESLNTQLLGNSQDPDDYNISFHISKTDASSGNLPIASPYTNTNPVETIFVRVQNKDTSCVNDDVTFDIIINSLPEFNVNATQILCLNDTPKNIFVEEPAAIYSYIWNDASGNMLSIEKNLDIAIGGSYSVTATTTNGTNCSRTKTIVVTESNPANLLPSYITIVDQGNAIGSEDNLSIVIDVLNNNLGPGDYQFALRNDDQNTTTPYQDNPLFENLEGGIYTIIVNDKNGCVPDATLQVSVLQFPEFFTPNGDNKNDTWIIKGANKTFYPNSKINIFNRYGKIVAQIPIDENGWDGNYNSKKMPSDDYWYNITLIPADTSKPTINKIGNFSLLRK